MYVTNDSDINDVGSIDRIEFTKLDNYKYTTLCSGNLRIYTRVSVHV